MSWPMGPVLIKCDEIDVYINVLSEDRRMIEWG